LPEELHYHDAEALQLPFHHCWCFILATYHLLPEANQFAPPDVPAFKEFKSHQQHHILLYSLLSTGTYISLGMKCILSKL
jgi:hypothetical protein